MVTINKKSGFSIAEALIAMLILSTFFIVTSKAINIKPKEEVTKNPHAFYECYVDDNSLEDRFVMNGSLQKLPEHNNCQFTPPKDIPHVIIYVINGDVFYNTIQPQLTNKISFSSTSEIEDIYNNFEEKNENSNKLEFKNFLANTYSESKIYELMGGKDSIYDYKGPAVFFGW